MNPRLAIKMHQGGTKYSDYQPPYASYEQRDFSSGRGLNDADLDGTRFYDSFRANTWMSEKVLPGPLEYFTTGYRNAESNLWTGESGASGYNWVNLYGANKYIPV
jgi:hypothetical protein